MKSFCLLLLLLLPLFSGCHRASNVVIYPAPDKMKPSGYYHVFVNDKPVFVYAARVAFDDLDPLGELENPDIASVAYFDFAGIADIDIVLDKNITEKVTVRPLSSGIQPRVRKNKISFTLTKPCKLSVEIGDRSNSNLMLFANSLLTSLPQPDDTSVIYFGPGIHEITDNDGTLILKSHQTLFLDGGAILRTRIVSENSENVKIMGHGIIDGSSLTGRWPDYLRRIMGEADTIPRRHLIEFIQCRNISLEGVILLDPPCFAVSLKECSVASVKDLKIVSYVPNSDGIDPSNCQNIIVDNVFIRTGDDCIAIKGYNWLKYGQDVKNIRVKNSILWADRASALEIGHETGVGRISGIYFSNIDILQQSLQTMGYHAMDITVADNALITDVHYDSIRVERCSRLLGLRISPSKWSAAGQLGKIENISFNAVLTYTPSGIFLYGYDSLHTISGITIRDLIDISDVSDSMPVIHANLYAENIRIFRHGKEMTSCSSVFPTDLKYAPVDISSHFNRSRRDSYKGDGKGWLDLGPSLMSTTDEKDLTVSGDMKGLKGGIHIFGAIPFNIAADNESRGSVIMLSSGKNLTHMPSSTGEIGILDKTRYIFFLQTSAFEKSDLNTILWKYIIEYKDGTRIIVPVRNKVDVGDWKLWSIAGWQYSIAGARIYVMPWQNPMPDKEILSVAAISLSDHEVPVIFAMTLGK